MMKHQHPEKISQNFIVCTGRTGSTLLASMLNMHPNVVAVSEETFTHSLFLKYRKVKNWNYTIIEQFCHDFFLFSEGKLEPQFGTRQDLEAILKENLQILNTENAIKLAHLCFFPAKEKTQVNTLVDKQLIFHTILEEVAELYPESKFILLTRDPRDNALVKWRRAQRENRKGYYAYYAFAWEYVYGLLNKKKDKIGRGRFLHIKYENLATHPEQTLKEISSFLNIPYDDVMLQYDDHLKKEFKSNEAVFSDTLKKNIEVLHKGLTEKVNTKKVGFWKQNLSQEQADLVWDICGETAEKFGYPSEGCARRSKKNLEYIICYLKFLYVYVMIPSLYFKLPISIRSLIKRLKYGNKFKTAKFTGEDFYKASSGNA
jgi:hypothetical protein